MGQMMICGGSQNSLDAGSGGIHFLNERELGFWRMGKVIKASLRSWKAF